MDEDRFTHRLFVGALWAWWLASVVPWLCVSWYQLDAHHDPGSFIGGGICMALLSVVVFGLLAVAPWRRRG